MSIEPTPNQEGSDTTAQYTTHYEPPEQGGERYVRCATCGAELLTCLGGRENLVHAAGCPEGERR